MPTRKIQKPKYIRRRPTKKKKQSKKAIENNSQTKNFVYSYKFLNILCIMLLMIN